MLLQRIRAKDADTAIHVQENQTIKWIDGVWWEPSFSQLEGEFTDEQREEAGMIYIVMD